MHHRHGPTDLLGTISGLVPRPGSAFQSNGHFATLTCISVCENSSRQILPFVGVTAFTSSQGVTPRNNTRDSPGNSTSTPSLQHRICPVVQGKKMNLLSRGEQIHISVSTFRYKQINGSKESSLELELLINYIYQKYQQQNQ